MLKNIFFICGLVLFGTLPLRAQQLGMHFMENVWQVNHTNPAIAPNQKIIFSFPNVYGNFSHSAASYNDLITVNSEGQTIINSSQWISQLARQNHFNLQADIQSFNLAVTVADLQFSLHQGMRMNGTFTYPRNLVRAAFEGNAPFIGELIDIAPSFNLLAFNEIGIGFNTKINALSIGGRIKALNGIGTVTTSKSSIKLHTDEEIYQLNLTSDYQINSAGLLKVEMDDSDFSADISDEYGVGDFFKMNRGWALDLGAQFRVSEQLTVAASVVDLGYIRWKENASNLTSNGTFAFEGFDIDDFINEDEVEFNANVDSLLETFNFVQTNEAFTTFLPSKIYLSGTYQVNELFRTGALIYLENQQGKTFKALSLNGTLDLGRIFSLGLVYSIYNRTYNNVGVNFQLKLGPVQLFGASDNVLAITRPANHRNTNARVGLNLAFGKREKGACRAGMLKR